MDRRNFLGSICAVFGAGTMPGPRRLAAPFGKDEEDGWFEVRTWRIEKGNPLMSVFSSPPILLVNNNAGMYASTVAKAFGDKGVPCPVPVIDCSGYIPLDEVLLYARSGNVPDVPCFFMLQRKGSEERVQFIAPTGNTVLNTEWATRFFADAARAAQWASFKKD